MDRNYLRTRIIAMLDEADEQAIRLIYRFVCGLVYK